MAAERGAFDIDDVARGITEKMVRRNPHVFAPSAAEQPQDAAAVNDAWEAIKAEEKAERTAANATRSTEAKPRGRSENLDPEIDA